MSGEGNRIGSRATLQAVPTLDGFIVRKDNGISRLEGNGSLCEAATVVKAAD